MRVLKTYIDPEIYSNVTNKNMAYLLGFIWADGNIDRHMCTINFKTDDFNTIKNVFDCVGKWTYKNYYTKDDRCKKLNEMTLVRMYNTIFTRFLKDNDYDKKSYISANKILAKVPHNLKSYFFRGLIDGDGCWFYIKEKRNKSLSITSTYEQDWSYFQDILKELNIQKYIISKIIRKNINRKHSQLIIGRLEEIKIFGNYIYNNFEYENIGFNRKYQIYKEIITKFTKQNFSDELKNKFITLVRNGICNKDICIELSINKKSCEYLKYYLNKKKLI